MIGAGNHLFFTNAGGQLVRVPLGGTTEEASVNTSGIVRNMGTLGEGGLLYTGSRTGVLQVWSQSTLEPLWTLNHDGGFVSSPAIDCSRSSAGAPIVGPGVLYVGANWGLLSVFVDSKGLDTTAPWPKFGHDPRNTNNSSTPLPDFACP